MPAPPQIRICPIALVVLLSIARCGEATGGQAGPGGVTERDVLPIFQMRCVVCHGKRKQEAALDLRTQAARLKGGKSGPALVPGKPQASLLIRRIEAGEMPPKELLFANSVRPPSRAEIQKLRDWIAAGAPAAPTATHAPNRHITAQQRAFWAYRRPARPPVPAAEHQELVRTPIDAFVLRKQETAGLCFAPVADRLTLLRRVTLDLTGLPPSPEETADFLNDAHPEAYERLVDRLLASPQYGERWGKFWLDAAGYSDSEGKVDSDRIRPHAWRYRDYVIGAFNDDKPYDAFLTEQLAGDEMVDYRGAKEITPEIYEKVVATGFLRMVPDGTYSPPQSFIPERMNVIHDALTVLGTAVLGLTLECARCHDHKYDPLTQRDYYSLSAVLQTAYDPYDWLIPTERYLDVVRESERRAIEAHNAAVTDEVRRLEQQIDRLWGPLREKLRGERLAAIPEVIRGDVAEAVEAEAEKRTAVQKYLAEKFEKQLSIADADIAKRFPEDGKRADELRKAIAAQRSRVRDMPKVRALFDMGGEPSTVYVLGRGEALMPLAETGPGVPAVLADGLDPYEVHRPLSPNPHTSGRRLALAQWLTQPNHPLTARVMVNRMWMHHFGVGLVPTPANFGSTGQPSTHPELLDWLATEFVRQGWSMKAMHRLMVTSTVYRQLSSVTSEQIQHDPDNRLLTRMPLQRMDAETLYDSILAVTGRLDLRPGGSADPVQTTAGGEVVANASAPGRWRRSVYVLARRREPVTMLEAFDVQPLSPNCIQRPNSTVATQALQLLNANLIKEHVRALAGALMRQAGDDRERLIRSAYATILSRPPTDEEARAGVADLAKLQSEWSQYLAQGQSDASAAARMALADFCHALISSAEFAYID